MDIYFSQSFGSVQICDACRFAILNIHYCCKLCGLELCAMCFDELQEKTDRVKKWMEVQKCINGQLHHNDFQLASFKISSEIYRQSLNAAITQFERYSIQNGRAICNGNHNRARTLEGKCYCPQYSSVSEIPIEPICVIKDQFETKAYAYFKAHMAAHNPVIVENVDKHPKFRPKLWTQVAFEKLLRGDKNLRILNSMDFMPVQINGKPCSLQTFWNKFSSRRVENDLYMKIKDFPESMLFSALAPDQHKNSYEIFPFLDYTHINPEECDRGRLNLLNFLNDEMERPDPGPKAYICFGLYNAPALSSTPLHLDVSDAVNFLPIVKAPDDLTLGEINDLVEKRLDLEGITGYQKERALRSPEKAGAIWKIFHPKDNDKLRQVISKWQKSKEEEWDDDVIHNQNVVVTPELVQILKENGVMCRMFVQNQGDVVFIPSGAAHHVQNINSCIKVAEDFVSAEGIDHTIKTNEELRFLRAKDDLVQVDKVLYRACAAATQILKNCEPEMVTSRLPQ